MGRITAEIAPGTDHPTLDSIKQRNTHRVFYKKKNLKRANKTTQHKRENVKMCKVFRPIFSEGGGGGE
jgi:hypothetical protein